MPTVHLRYVGALTHADVPILRREGEPLDEHGDGCLVHGEAFICDAKIAGRAPKLDKNGALELDDAGQPVDAGEGLLAQPGNFEYADKSAAMKRTARRPRKTAAKKPDPSPSPSAAADNTDATKTEV